MNKIKKPLALLLALMMLMTAMPLAAIPAFAAETVTYLDANGNMAQADCTAIASDTLSWSGWMAVSGKVTIDDNVNLTDDTNLILTDGAELTINGVITGGKTLTVYAQSTGDSAGKLVVEPVTSSGTISCISGNLTVHGGTVYITPTASCSTVYGIYLGVLTVTGGNVNMELSAVTSCFGVGASGNSGNAATVTGGSVTMDITGGSCYAFFANQITGNALNITGGEVEVDATASFTAYGVCTNNITSDSVNISGGKFVYAGESGNGNGVNASNNAGDTLVVSGGEVYISETSSSGYALYSPSMGDGYYAIKHTGGTVNLYGGKYATASGNDRISVLAAEVSSDGVNYSEWDGEAFLNGYKYLRFTAPEEEPETPSVDLSKLSTGAKIQLGTQSGSPVEWVIGGDGSTGMSVPEGCIALVSSGLVASDTKFDVTGYSNIYATSNLKSVVENAVSFTDDEKALIQSRTLGSPDIAGDPVTAMVWAPTLADAESLSGAGLSGIGSYYLLCSPGDAEYLAANVYPDGGVEPYGVDTSDPEGVRAGLYIDLSKITGLTLVEGTTDTYILNAPEEEPGVDLSKLSTGTKIIYGTATYGSNNGKALEWVVAGDGKTGMEVPDGCIALALTNNVMKEYLFDNQDPIDNHYSTSNLTDIFNTGIALTKTQESAIKSRTLEGGKTAGDNCDGVAGDSVTVNFWAPTVKDANALKEVGLSATGWEYTLSSPGTYGTNYVACVFSNGNISVGGTEVNIWNFFRPAFYLDLSKIEAINEVEDAENTYTLDIMHTHAFSEKWSTDENAHWHECTAEECDIEDYSTCGIDEVAYGEHIGMDDDYTCDTCGYVNAEGQLVNAVTEAKAALNTAKNNAKSDAAKAILDGAITALDDAESLDDVDTIKSDALENAKGADDALAEAIATAKSDLETAKNNAKSDAAKAAIADAIAELADATNLPAVENIVDKANNAAAEHDKELAEVKATAKEALNTALTNAKSDAAKAALNEAIATVDNATDPDTVAEAKTTGTINAAIADKALADAQAEAKKALETAKAEATSKEAKAAIDKAIANVEKATNPADVASAKSAGITAAANADKTLADTISNFKKNLETAKNDAKSDAAKAVYADAIAALDNAKSLEDVETIVESAEMNAANADKALADAKTDAKKELETAKANAVSDAAKAALDEAIANVEKATSPDAVASAKSTGTTAAADADKALADAKAEAKKALETAKAEAISKEAKAAIDKAIANVEKATNPADVASAKSAGITAAANADKTLADTISNFKNTLETAKNDAKSDAAKAAYTDAIAALDNAKSLEDVETIVESAEMNAANADKALADAKTDAKKELETAKTNAVSDAAKAALDEAIANVEKATSPADVASAESAGTTAAAAADKALDDAKAEAKEALETAKENAKSDAAKAAIEKAEKAIDEATNPADVASEKAAAETAAAEADKALADAQAEAVEALEAAKEKAVSDEAKAALDEAIADVEKATNPTDAAAAKTSGLENAADADEALAEAIENAKADLAEAEKNAVADDAKAALSAAAEDMDNATSLAAVADKKAAAEEAAEAAEKELADAKAAAIEAVEALAGDDATDEVKQLVEDAKEAINAATSPEAVDTAEDNGLAAVEHKQQEEGFTVPDLDIQLGYRETAPVNAESTTNKIIYTSSNEKVVTVDENGNLKAVGKGKATITATLEGTDISEEIEIEVSYTFWDGLVWHIRNLLELIASGFKWLLGLIGINL